MDDKHIEESAAELIEELKNKIEVISQSPTSQDEEVARKIEFIKDKAVFAFDETLKKLSRLSDVIADPQEREKIIDTARLRSMQFYEEALNKIDALLKDDDHISLEKEETDENNKIDQIIESVDNEFKNIVNTKEVSNLIDKTKAGAVDVAEKALEILKDWLSVEGEDQ